MVENLDLSFQLDHYCYHHYMTMSEQLVQDGDYQGRQTDSGFDRQQI